MNQEQRRTKVSFGRTMMRALGLQQLAKRLISGRIDIEQCEDIKPITLAVMELRLFEAISQSDSQQKNLLNRNFKNFITTYVIQRLKIDLKTFSGLAMPNQCCHAVTKLIFGWFVGGIFGQET